MKQLLSILSCFPVEKNHDSTHGFDTETKKPVCTVTGQDSGYICWGGGKDSCLEKNMMGL